MASRLPRNVCLGAVSHDGRGPVVLNRGRDRRWGPKIWVLFRGDGRGFPVVEKPKIRIHLLLRIIILLGCVTGGIIRLLGFVLVPSILGIVRNGIVRQLTVILCVSKIAAAPAYDRA